MCNLIKPGQQHSATTGSRKREKENAKERESDKMSSAISMCVVRNGIITSISMNDVGAHTAICGEHQHHARREWIILRCNRSRSADGSRQPCRASGGRYFKGLSHPNGAAGSASHGERPKTSHFPCGADKQFVEAIGSNNRMALKNTNIICIVICQIILRMRI
jgi:hypothetical protein